MMRTPIGTSICAIFLALHVAPARSETGDAARERHVKAGTETPVARHARWNSRCESLAYPIIKVLASPRHGTIRTGELTYKPSSALPGSRWTHCLGREISGSALFYTADSQYAGDDEVLYSVTYPNRGARGSKTIENRITFRVAAPVGQATPPGQTESQRAAEPAVRDLASRKLGEKESRPDSASPAQSPDSRAPKPRAASTIAAPSCQTLAYLAGDSRNADYIFKKHFGLDYMKLADADFDFLLDTLNKCKTVPSHRLLENYFKDATNQLIYLRRLRDSLLSAERAAADRYREQIFLIKSLGEELDRIPNAIEGQRRLEEIQDQLRRIATPGRPEYDKTVNDARNEVFKKIDAKRELIFATDREKSKASFIASAQLAVERHYRTIATVGLPTTALDSTILLEQGYAGNKRFIKLRQWIGLLLDQDGVQITVTEVDKRYRIAVKKPAQRTVVFVFQIDGGDAFLNALAVGEVEENLDTLMKQIQGEQVLREWVKASMW